MSEHDIENFNHKKKLDAEKMHQDNYLSKMALEVFIEADKYNYSYQWSWLGLPIIQVPQDIIALQEIIWQTKPTLIIETGIARGGSLIFLASMMQLLGRGRVIGIDIDIREHNRKSIEAHPFYPRIQLLQGSSVDSAMIQQIKSLIKTDDSVMVILDSNHTHEHVLQELVLYAPMVSTQQYLIVADTIIEDIPSQVHRQRPWGPGNNPKTALKAFLAKNNHFEVDQGYNHKLLHTSNPDGYLIRRS